MWDSTVATAIPGGFQIASLDFSQSRVRGPRGLRFSSVSFCRVILLTVPHRRASILQRRGLIDFARQTLPTWYRRHPLNADQRDGCHTRPLLTHSFLYLSTLTTICALRSHSMYRGASQVADKTSLLDSPPQIRSALLSFLPLLAIGSNRGLLGSTRSLTPEGGESTYASVYPVRAHNQYLGKSGWPRVRGHLRE